MANIKINDLQASEFEFVELSDLELEAIVGGKSSTAKKVIGLGSIAAGGLFNGLSFRF
jgi:hypothetical protein